MKQPSMTEVVYTPRSELLNPLKFVGSMFKGLFASRELAWRLFVRDISSTYRQSFLGYIWAFLPPLATTLTFVFLRSQNLFTTGSTSIPYPAYVIIGMLFWQVFVDSVQCPLKAVTAAKPMLSKIQFPPEALLLSALGQVLFSFLMRCILLVGALLWYQLIPPGSAFLVPVAIVALMMLGLMFGVLVTPIGMLYTDVTQSLTVVLTFWMFFTPVVYPPPGSGLGALICRWNPVSPLLTVGRDWLTGGPAAHLPEFFLIAGLSTIMLFVAWVCYRVSIPHLIARIGN